MPAGVQRTALQRTAHALRTHAPFRRVAFSPHRSQIQWIAKRGPKRRSRTRLGRIAITKRLAGRISIRVSEFVDSTDCGPRWPGRLGRNKKTRSRLRRVFPRRLLAPTVRIHGLEKPSRSFRDQAQKTAAPGISLARRLAANPYAQNHACAGWSQCGPQYPA